MTKHKIKDLTGENILGFQVVDDNGNMPNNMYSFQIYPFEICLAIVKTDKQKWKLLPIWEGDIEDPEIWLC